MRKYIPLLLLLSGCVSSANVWQQETIVYGLDFREYEDFLFTPNEYQGEYESIGIVRVVLRPSVINNPKNQVQGREYIERYASSSSRWYIEVLEPQDAVGEAYRVAVDMGADGLTQFSIDEVELTNGPIMVPALEIYGFAIRRK